MKFNFDHIDTKEGFSQIPKTFRILMSTPSFIRTHKLWRGFLDYRWVLILSIIIASFFSLILVNNLYDYLFPDESKGIEININNEDLEESIKPIEEGSENISEVTNGEIEISNQSLIDQKENLKEEHRSVFSGSLKFLLLIFLEVLIFHFAVKTNNILKGEKVVLKFNQFYKAQIRMIKVMFRKWVYGLIMYILISIACSIIGFSFMIDPIMFFVYGFYLGFAFLDNYLEQSGFTIKESAKCIQSHFGASTVIGLFASIFMHIPLVGPLLVPFICAIAATRYGHESKMEAFAKTIEVA